MKKRISQDLRELKGLLREKGISYETAARSIRMSSGAFNNKINGFSIFRASEVELLVSILEIDPKDVVLYFFPAMLRNATNPTKSA